MSEETTTETVLYEIAREHQSGDYIAIPATKAAEAKHGADWLWWFGDKSTGVGFRVQAKKLFPSGRHESLRKKTGDPYAQLKSLVDNAEKTNQTPLYCFYNFDLPGHFAKSDHHCRHGYRAPSYWGCAVALPEDIQRQNSDLLGDLEEYMLPWHLLVCTKRNSSLADAAISAGRLLAATKPMRKSKNRIVSTGRDALDIKFDKRSTPPAVREIMEIHERSRPTDAQVDGWEEINIRAQHFLDEQNVSGLAIFNDARLDLAKP